MQKLSKKFYLTMSPFHPNFEKVGNMTVRLAVPYSSERVTIEIEKNMTLSLESQKTRAFEFQGKNYEGRFLNTDSVTEAGQNYLRFQLQITEL